MRLSIKSKLALQPAKRLNGGSHTAQPSAYSIRAACLLRSNMRVCLQRVSVNGLGEGIEVNRFDEVHIEAREA